MERVELQESPHSHESATNRRQYLRYCDCKWIDKRYVVVLLMSLGLMISFGINYLFGAANIGFHTSFTPFFVKPALSSSPNITSQEVVDLTRSTFFWGELAAQLPAGFLAFRYRATWILGFSLACLGCLNVLLPLASQLDLILLAVVRCAQGFAEGMLYPSVIAIMRWWAPANERSRLLTLTFCGSHVGAVIFSLLSRRALHMDEWQPLAYIFGVFALLWHVLWVLMVFEKPSAHPLLTQSERLRIEGSSDCPDAPQSRASPWCGLITSCPVYAIVVANVCYSSAYYLMLPDQKVDAISTPFHAMVGDWAFALHLALIVVIVVCGELSDFLPRKNLITSTNVRKSLVGGIFLFKALAIVATISFPMYTKSAAVLPMLVFFVSGFDGYIVWAVLYLNCLDIAPKYAALLVAASNFISVVSGFTLWKSTSLLLESVGFSPTYVAYLSWALAAVMLIIGAICYCVFASAEIQPWAAPRKQDDISSANENQIATPV